MLDKINSYYDRSTDAWINLFNSNRIEAFRFFESEEEHDNVISNALKFAPGENVLDAGCGVGYPGINFAKKFSKTNFYLLNINDYQLNRIPQLENVFKVKQDYHDTGFEDNFFDKVYFLESFSHSIYKKKLINEIFRILKPGGRLLILDFCRKKNISKDALNVHRTIYSHFPILSTLMKKLFLPKFKEIFFFENLKNNIVPNKGYDKERFFCYNGSSITDFGKVHLEIHEKNAHAQYPVFMMYSKI